MKLAPNVLTRRAAFALTLVAFAAVIVCITFPASELVIIRVAALAAGTCLFVLPSLNPSPTLPTRPEGVVNVLENLKEIGDRLSGEEPEGPEEPPAPEYASAYTVEKPEWIVSHTQRYGEMHLAQTPLGMMMVFTSDGIFYYVSPGRVAKVPGSSYASCRRRAERHYFDLVTAPFSPVQPGT